MRSRPFGILVAFAMILSCTSAASAQTNNLLTCCFSPFDPHDLSGLWSQDHPRTAPVVERYWNYEFSKEPPPMTAWGKRNSMPPNPLSASHLSHLRKPTIRSTTVARLPACRAFTCIRFRWKSFRRPAKSLFFSSTIPCGIRFLRMGASMTKHSARCGWGTRSGIGRETRWSRTQ